MTAWCLTYNDFVPAEERLREALCTLGNGYFATRGAAPEASAGEYHYPGTYLAGGYNRLESEIAGRVVQNEDLVNLPNWLPLGFRIGDAEWFDLKAVEILNYCQRLDLRCGLLERTVRFRDGAGRLTRIAQRRLVHMAFPHLAALETVFTAENWSGTLEVCSALDGTVTNGGVARYRALANRHLEPVEQFTCGPDVLFLRVRTIQSRLEVAEAARTRLFRAGVREKAHPREAVHAGYAAQHYCLELSRSESLRVEKIVSLYTSRDRAIAECGEACRTALERAGDFEALLARQTLAWTQAWRRFDMTIDGGAAHQRTALVLRLHIFHLLQSVSPNTIDLDTGVPARGWHGEAYRGHVFWDELFIFPLLNLRLPEITRALLVYRYRRLDEARHNARAQGFRGALYPWQSGSSGREESQSVHLNPTSGRWIPDNTHLQRHVNSAIAFNIWQYYEATRDLEFMSFHGAEMFLEIARFWASYAVFNEALGRYEIKGVVGPDEFHTQQPYGSGPGLDNHAYTSVMAVWVLCRAFDVLDRLPEERRMELREILELSDEELVRWQDVSHRMRLVWHGDGVLSQFEGYEQLAELDWSAYRDRYGDLQRLDRILEAEGDDVNRYRVSKQADVLMLFYVFSSEELAELFGRLGYAYDNRTIPRNVAFYAPRTSHGSTLSRVVDSWVLARSDRAGSWRVFLQALESDIADVQGGTTAEGIHLGAMAGTVDLLQRGYTGVMVREGALHFDPKLPQELKRLGMTLHYRGHALEIEVTPRTLHIRTCACNAPPIRIAVRDRTCELAADQSCAFDLAPPPEESDGSSGTSRP